MVIPPFLTVAISRVRPCVVYAASVCSHSTPYLVVRDYKTIATAWHSSAIHPAMKTDAAPASHNALSGYITQYSHSAEVCRAE